MSIITETSTTIRLDENNSLHVFDVRGYRVVTFNFYIVSYDHDFMQQNKVLCPAYLSAHIEFKGRFEILGENTKKNGGIYPGILFTFTNSDVATCIRLELEKDPDCKWIDMEVEIKKQPRKGLSSLSIMD